MSKRKPSRRQRRKGARGTTPPAARVAMPQPRPEASTPTAAPAAPSPPPAPAPARPSTAPSERRSSARAASRDYSYVLREVQRIIVLSGAIIILIVVLSFFLP